MFEDIDKLRRENGWKPRRRGSKTASGGGGAAAVAAATVSSGMTAGSGNSKNSGSGSSSHSILSGLEGYSSQQKSLAETLLQKLQTEMQLRPDQQESFRLQQEALRYVLKKRWKEAAAGLSFSYTHSKPIWPLKKPVLTLISYEYLYPLLQMSNFTFILYMTS